MVNIVIESVGSCTEPICFLLDLELNLSSIDRLGAILHINFAIQIQVKCILHIISCGCERHLPRKEGNCGILGIRGSFH